VFTTAFELHFREVNPFQEVAVIAFIVIEIGKNAIRL